LERRSRFWCGNKDRPQDLATMAQMYRPPMPMPQCMMRKYGIRNYQGREDDHRHEKHWTSRVRSLKTPSVACGNCWLRPNASKIWEGVADPNTVTLDQVESNIVRCPDLNVLSKMIDRIEQQVGRKGILSAWKMRRPQGAYKGWSPDKLEADIAKG